MKLACISIFVIVNKITFLIFSFKVLVFWVKNEKVRVLNIEFQSFFPSKFPTFWHISNLSFDRKRMKFVGVLIFITKNSMKFSFFYKTTKFPKIKASKWTFEPTFRQNERKSHSQESPSAETRIVLCLQKNEKRHYAYFHFGSHAPKFYSFSSKSRL